MKLAAAKKYRNLAGTPDTQNLRPSCKKLEHAQQFQATAIKMEHRCCCYAVDFVCEGARARSVVFSFPGGAVAATVVVASAGVRSASATSVRRPQKGAVSTGGRVGAGTCVWETANKAIVAVLHTYNSGPGQHSTSPRTWMLY